MAPRKNNKAKRTGGGKRRQAISRNGFSNVNTSPWNALTFFVQIALPADSWANLSNDSLQRALYEHLGFTPLGARFLEVRYRSLEAVVNQPEVLLALRLYRIETTFSADTKVNVMMSRESQPTNTISFARVKGTWDHVSQSTPLTSEEPTSIAAFYCGDAISARLKLSVLYRHAESPTVPTRLAVKLISPFEKLAEQQHTAI
jgi:hypothetical protein